MSIEVFEDGIKIGPDVNDRYAILDFDEYSDSTGLYEMSGNEKRWVTFSGMLNFRSGATLTARLANPHLFNQEDLLISHVVVSNNTEVKVLFINLNSSSVNFSSDQIVIGGWNTVLTE